MKLTEKKLCCGCSACVNICPVKCIEMQYDNEGFLYPQTDESRCIHCDICLKCCPVQKEKKRFDKGEAYACFNRDEGTRIESSSGGIFALLAGYVLEKGGTVFGAAFDECFIVRHAAVEDRVELKRLMGSKYVQSDMGNVYIQVRELLKEGKMVLFSGTPCQIGGLKAFLNREYENLILQDLICHGAPSPGVWKKYVRFREDALCAKTIRISFRNKLRGWSKYSVNFEFDNGYCYRKSFYDDSYMMAFLSDLCLRPSCYDCHFKSVERESDITLADFWGIENVAPELNDDKGTSLVFVNSAKGRMIFDAIADKIRVKKVDTGTAVLYNPSACISCSIPKNRKKFMNEIFINDFDKTVKKYTCKSLVIRVAVRIHGKIKRILKRMCGYVQK